MPTSYSPAAALLTFMLLAAAPLAAQTPPARVDDQVAAWAQQLRAEAEAIRGEGADAAVHTLERMVGDETRLQEQLSTAKRVDDLLPEMAQQWAEGADQLNRLSARMPEITASHRRHLQNLRGLLSQAQNTGRGVERQVETMRQELEAMRLRARAAPPGSPDAMRAELEAAAQAAALTAREAQARLATGFGTQAGQAIRRLEDASQGMDLLSTAIAAHARVLQASSDLARTRVVAQEALQLLADMADRLEGIDGVLQGLSQHWEALDGLLRRLGELPAIPGRAAS